MDWTHLGSLTKKFKVTQPAGKVLTVVFSDSLICSWWTSCNMDTQLTPTGSEPRWKACERSSRENDRVFLAMVSFTSMIMSSCTRHGRLRTCCRNLAAKRCSVPHTIQIWHSEIIFSPPPQNTTWRDIAPRAMQTSEVLPPLSWRNGGALSVCPERTNLSYGVTSASSVRGLCCKTAYQ